MTVPIIQPTPEQEPEVKVPRCSICGDYHPFVAICPFVRELHTEVEFGPPRRPGDQPHIIRRVERTSFYRRGSVSQKHSVSSLDDLSED